MLFFPPYQPVVVLSRESYLLVAWQQVIQLYNHPLQSQAYF